MSRHQYGISVLVSQTSFRGETSGGVAKCRLFSPASQGSSIFGSTPLLPCLCFFCYVVTFVQLQKLG